MYGLMNTLEIIGGRKDQREMAHRVVGYMINTLMPRMRTLDITVEFANIKSDAVGFCMQTDNNRTFEIEIDKKQNFKDIVTTLCHEMVHVKQYARKEMDDGQNTGRARWKTKTIPMDTKYYDLPWEKEAYRMQDKLADMCWENNIL